MRVLFPVHIFLPDSYAGVEQYTAQLAHAFQSQAEVAIVTTKKIISLETGTIRRTEVEGLSVWEVVNNLSHDNVQGTWSEPRLEQAFEQVLREFEPDVVHFQHLMYWSARLPALAKQSGAKVLHTLHDFWLMCARMGQLVASDGSLCHLPSEESCAPCMAATQYGQSPSAQAWIRRLIRVRNVTGVALDEPLRFAKRLLDGSTEAAQEQVDESELREWNSSFHKRRESFLALQESVDLFVTPSTSLRDRFVKWGLAEDCIRQLPQGRDHSPFPDDSSQPRPPTRDLHFGFLGSLAPHKGVEELLLAFAQVEAPGARLSVYGPHAKHPAYRDRLSELAAKDPRIRLMGPIARNDVPNILRSFDVSCVPSLWDECCPLTIQEAFMAGVPVIASDLGGLAELVRPGVGGLLAPPGDVNAWAEVLARLASDLALQTELRATIPEVPHLWKHVEELLELYG